MFRLSVAALVASASSTSDETSLMQGLKPTSDKRTDTDKSQAITSLMATATTLLKNGATSDVVDFAEATLTEITSIVLPAITNAHEADQQLVDATFRSFELALAALEQGTEEIKGLSNEERHQSHFHKVCRDEEEGVCYTKRECDYDIYAIWRRFVEEETTLRELSARVDTYFCAPDVNGTLQIFRDGAVALFPPWIEQKPVVERIEFEYDSKHPDCETKFVNLDTKTEICDAYQAALEAAACAHAHKVREVREEFSISWNQAITSYQHVVDEVHCLEIDRWKEWRTLSTVQCLLDRTRERNGRECDESTDEVVEEVTHCEQVQYDTDITHLLIVYYMIPELPPYCAITPWPIADPLPGRCQPRIPEAPCTAGFIAQEYAELWTPPQPEFYGGINFEEGNSHCNQRPECVMCPIVPEPPICAFIMEGHGNDQFVLPQPEHECHFATRAQIEAGHYESVEVVRQE